MEKLKEALIQFTHSNPSLFPNDADNSYAVLIDHCFPNFFSDFQTPNHPPYAAMIYKAISELNKKGGSSEESISEHIKNEYASLPWAHTTLLKHHLEKLCDCKEILITDKQCYLLAGEDSDSGKKTSTPTKKRKKQTGQPGTERVNKRGRPCKKIKKNGKVGSGIQKTDKGQMALRKRKRKRLLKSKIKSGKHGKKKAVNDDAKLQLLDEENLKENNEVNDEVSHEQNGLRKRKRKHGLKYKKKSSKRVKKHTINEANLAQSEVNDDKSHKQKQTLEVKMGDIQIQEQNDVGQESDHNNSGCVNLEQTETKKNTELLQPEESPDSNPTLNGNGKRVLTRSQLKTVTTSSELTDSIEKQHISRSTSLDKPLIELFKPMSSKLMPEFPAVDPTAGSSSTEVRDPLSCQQDQQPEKLPLDGKDKPKYKRRGRPPKSLESKKSKVKSQQSAKKLILPDDEPTAATSSTELQGPLDDKPKYKRRGRPRKRVQVEKSKVKSLQAAKKGKVKVGKRKGQPKNKGNGRHKMPRRSSRKPSLR